MPIFRRFCFGTVSLSRQKPAVQQALTIRRFNDLADFCQIETRLERELPFVLSMTHLTFTLPDGTRAGIVPTQDLRGFTVEQLRLGCLAPAKDVSVVFYVPNKQALDRVMTRFGLTEC